MNKILYSCDFLIDHWFFGLPFCKFIRSSQFIALATLLSHGYKWKQYEVVLVNVKIVPNFLKYLTLKRTFLLLELLLELWWVFFGGTTLEHISDKLFWRINYSSCRVVNCDITLFLERFNSLYKWVSCLNWKVTSAI